MIPRTSIYTDGACIGNPGPGGWAALLKQGDHEKVLTGHDPATTNNRMELTAVIRGVEALKLGRAAILYSDSRYVVDGLTKYLAGWKARGWRRADKKPVLNQDLWEELEAATGRREVRLEWIKGHAGHPENERVDRLAEAAARGSPYSGIPNVRCAA